MFVNRWLRGRLCRNAGPDKFTSVNSKHVGEIKEVRFLCGLLLDLRDVGVLSVGNLVLLRQDSRRG
jgi:hypothetical protein